MLSGLRYVIAAVAFLVISASSVTLLRIDSVYVISGGAVAHAQGTPTSSLSAPTLPLGSLPLANVNVAANQTRVTSENIADKRIINPNFSNMSVINVKDFGAKGDGITDDTEAIQTAINYKKDGTVLIPDGDYLISSTITDNNSTSLNLSKNARIFTNTALKDLIIYNDAYIKRSLEGLSSKPFISGGTLDGNNLTQNIISISQYMGFKISDIRIKNFLAKGLVTSYNSLGGAELEAHSIQFRNSQANIGSIAIYNNGHDNLFHDIIVMDVETAVWGGDGLFTRIHHWIQFADLIPNSCMFNIQDGFMSISQCYADTIRYPFKLASGKIARISDLLVLYNTSVYTPALAQKYPITFFSGDTNVNYYVKNSLLCIPYNLTMCQYPYEQGAFVDNIIAKTSDSITVTNIVQKNAKTQLKGNQTLLSKDLNNALETQFITITSGSSYSNFPSDAYEYGTLIVNQGYGTTVQIYIPQQSNAVYFRSYSGTWSSWIKIGTSASSTANRPTTGLYTGYMHFDTTLGKPIWWDGAVWKDATGATV